MVTGSLLGRWRHPPSSRAGFVSRLPQPTPAAAATASRAAYCEPCTPQATTRELWGMLETLWIPYGSVLRTNVAAQVAPAPPTLKIHSAWIMEETGSGLVYVSHWNHTVLRAPQSSHDGHTGSIPVLTGMSQHASAPTCPRPQRDLKETRGPGKKH